MYKMKFTIFGFRKNYVLKGEVISKANCQTVNSSKKRTNEFVFTTTRCIFIQFFEEIEDSKKTFRNHLTFVRYFEKAAKFETVLPIFGRLIKGQ